MNKKEVIARIGEKRWEAFTNFMYGQTVRVNPDGSIDYYEVDVENFLKAPKKRFFD